LGSQLAVANIIDFGDLPVFETATAYPMILVGFKHAPVLAPTFTQVTSLEPPYPEIKELIRRQGIALQPSSVQSDTWQLSSSSLSTISSTTLSLINLTDYTNVRVLMGIKTGLNEAFVIDDETREFLIDSDHEALKIIKPFTTGRRVRRWTSSAQGSWLIYTRHGVDISRCLRLISHLREYKSRLESRATKQAWYELQQPQGYYAEQYEAPKIIFPDIAQRHRFSLDTTGQYPANTAYILPTSDLFLLGLLNSTPVEEFYLTISAQVRGGYVRFFRQYVERIPIPLASPADKRPIEDLVQKCLDAKGQGPQVAEWEAEIDERVAWLYGLRTPPDRPEPEDDGA
jgi:hypothetical protein